MLGQFFKKKLSRSSERGDHDVSPVDQMIRKLEIKAQRLAQQRLLGRYRSRFKGRGLDFRDFREYFPGDDTRTIDWNVTARFGRPFVKNSEEERELSVIIILDCSPSQNFGSGTETKEELAQQLASLMTLTAVASGDKVGLLKLDGKRAHYIPRGKGRHQKQRILKSIWTPLCEQSQTVEADLYQSLEDLSYQLRRRGFLCFISDFLRPEFLEPESSAKSERLLAALRKLSFRHEVIALRTLDNRERDFPRVGSLVLRDQTDGRTVRIDTNHPDWKKTFQERWQRWNSAFSDLFKRARWDWQEFLTDADPLPPLAAFLDARGRR
ncbi:MAG: DUF58 domain-containing protein [Vulcanimicrobiota bacterium]